MSLFLASGALRVQFTGTASLDATTQYTQGAPQWTGTPIFSAVAGQTSTQNVTQVNAGSSTVTLSWVSGRISGVLVSQPSWLSFGAGSPPTITFTNPTDADDVTDMVLRASANGFTQDSSAGSITVSAAPQSSGEMSIPEGVAFPEQGQPVDSGYGPIWHVGVVGPQGIITRGGWNHGTGAQWNNAGGDWIDSNLTSQGSAAWGTVSGIAPGGERAITVNITALMQRQKGRGYNRGIMLRGANSAFDQVYAGRSNATSSKRPTITLNLRRSDAGIGYPSGPPTLQVTLPCLWSVEIGSWTQSYIGGPNTFTVASDNKRSLLYFDLSNWYSQGWSYDTLDSAILNLTLLSLGGSTNATLNVFELDGPDYVHAGCVVGSVGVREASSGIAGGYVKDVGIGANAQVKHYFDFTDLRGSSVAGTQYHWSSGGTIGTDPLGNYVASEYHSASDSTRYKCTWKTGIGSGLLSAERYINDVKPGLPGIMSPASRIDRAHLRYNIEIDASVHGVETSGQNMKMPGLAMRHGIYEEPSSIGARLNFTWNPQTGNGGTMGNGLRTFNGATSTYNYSGNSARMKLRHRTGEDNPYGSQRLYHMHCYLYHREGQAGSGTFVLPPGVVLLPNTRYCVEQMLQINTMSGFDANGNASVVNPDAILRIWINGVRYVNQSNFSVTANEQMGVQSGWLDIYHGGILATDRDMWLWLDSAVLALDYIGQRRES